MNLLNTDILAIIIALGGACTVMVVSLVAHRRLMHEHIQLERAYEGLNRRFKALSESNKIDF